MYLFSIKTSNRLSLIIYNEYNLDVAVLTPWSINTVVPCEVQIYLFLSYLILPEISIFSSFLVRAPSINDFLIVDGYRSLLSALSTPSRHSHDLSYHKCAKPSDPISSAVR